MFDNEVEPKVYETYTRRESMLKLREELLSVEEVRLNGREGISVNKLDEMMRKAISEAKNG